MVTAPPALMRDVDEIMPGVVADRRHLHQHPELGFQEFETAKFIAERLRSLGLDDVQTEVGRTGVVGILRGGKPGKVVALRADMDALPVDEENDVEYKSLNNGKMHACGHDAHVSMMLGAARVLASKREEIPGTIKFIFQPAEEGLGGALAMMADGVLENPRPDAIFGLHIWQEAPSGVVQIRDTVAMVAGDGFKIEITGKGGHGATPHTAIDPIAIGSEIVAALQTIMSRNIDPILAGVVTIGSFHAGNAANVIPSTAELTGTIRTVTIEEREEIHRRVEQIARGVARAMRADIEFTLKFGVSATVNDPAMAAIAREAAIELVGPDRVEAGELKVVSEDMSVFLNEVPGCYYFVGSRNPDKGFVWGHHHARFDIDEDAMAVGVSTLAGTAMLYLQKNA
ncbi:MAG: M20 metallopeptidase family protein [Thermomicrobiales bacterium]